MKMSNEIDNTFIHGAAQEYLSQFHEAVVKRLDTLSR